MANKFQDDFLKFLNSCYEKSKQGVESVLPPVATMASGYLRKYHDPYKAAKALQKAQITKCSVSGFVNGFGGIIAMPVTIPANLGSVIFVQMRMIQATAYIGGFDINADEVQTFVYACLAGVAVTDIVKRFGVAFGEKMALKGIQKIPGKVFAKINHILAMRFITKMGEKGLINLGKMIPVAGAAINGGFDLVTTSIIAKRARKMFLYRDFNVGDYVDFTDELNDD